MIQKTSKVCRAPGILCLGLFLLPLSILRGAEAQAQAGAPAPLTMPQAIDRAMTANPTLLAAREHLSAVRAQKLTAAARVNPVLTVLGQGVTLPEMNNDGGNPYYYSANIARLFERGEKRRWRLDGAQATSDQTAEQLRDQERQVTLNVRQAFTGLLVAKGALAIAEENLTDYRKTLDLSKARLDAGDTTRTDYERIDLQLAQFEADDDNAKLTILQTSAQLQLLFGVERPDPAFDIAGDLALPPTTMTKAQVEQAALDKRPDLAAARQGLLAAQAGIRYAQANGTADPTAAAEYERSGADNTFGVSLAIPLRIFDRNQGEKDRTKFEANASRLSVQAARNQVVNDVDQAWDALETARRMADRYNNHYLDEAGRVRDNLQFSYRNGNSTLLDYLDALRSYRATHLSSLNANAQVWLALHQLSFAAATDMTP